MEFSIMNNHIKFIKKVIILSVLFSLSTNSEEIKNNRFYIGAGIGNENIIGSFNHTVNTNRFLSDNIIRLGNRRIVAKFVMGYDILLESIPIYLNIEASNQLGDMIIKRETRRVFNNIQLFIPAKITKKNIINIHVKLGLPHHLSIFYGKIGASYSIFNCRFDNSISAVDLKKNHTNKKVGISYGAGILYYINNKWRAFMDYEVTKYPLIQFSLNKSESYNFKPTTYTVTTGIQYIF
jgi:hypothetical protein